MNINPEKKPDYRQVFHGGDLSKAAELLGEPTAEGDWLDLSTGINLQAYPVPNIDQGLWQSLPDQHLLSKCLEQARDYYSVPSTAAIAVVGGSQMAIQLLPHLFTRTDVTIVGPTYSEHFASWNRAGHHVIRHDSLPPAISTVNRQDDSELISSICVLVNPNNPDGRLISHPELENFLSNSHPQNDWLIIDEAFMDLKPEWSAVDLTAESNSIVLKSFGKFFGLAGLRLGFVIGPPPIINKLLSLTGPWPVNGPALKISAIALGDRSWQDAMRKTLINCSHLLDRLLRDYDLNIAGGTNLFRLIETDRAEKLFLHLLQHKIYTRRFNRFPTWLRLGVPHLASQFSRLENGLSTFRNSR